MPELVYISAGRIIIATDRLSGRVRARGSGGEGGVDQIKGHRMVVRRTVVILGIAALVLAAFRYPVPYVVAAAIAGTIVVIPLVLPLGVVLLWMTAGAMLAGLLLLVDRMTVGIGPVFWIGLPGVVLFLTLLGEMLEALCRGNTSHLTMEALAERYRDRQRHHCDHPPYVFVPPVTTSRSG
jgi:hypothetical protein